MAFKETIIGFIILAATVAWVVALIAYLASRAAGRKRWLGYLAIVSIFLGVGTLAITAPLTWYARPADTSIATKRIARLARFGEVMFAVGSAILLGGFIYRWIDVRHVPLQNMFEVFLCLGMLMYPLVMFCEKVLGARRTWLSMYLGLVVLFPTGFVFHAEAEHLPPALQSWLFIPHVGAYMVSYIILALGAIQAGIQAFETLRFPVRRLCLRVWLAITTRLSRNEILAEIDARLSGHPHHDPNKRFQIVQQSEMATYRIILLGFPLLTLGLVLGAVWGKLAWGDYWNWDPKELWSLATFVVYVAYLHVRSLYGARHSLVTSGLALAGLLCVILTLLWVNLGRIFTGMHSYAT